MTETIAEKPVCRSVKYFIVLLAIVIVIVDVVAIVFAALSSVCRQFP